MLKAYIYILSLLLLLLAYINSIMLARKHAPSKIRIITLMVLALAMLRACTEFILFVSKNIVFLYTLKYFSLLNIAAIPIAALICLYIFLRDVRIKIEYVFIASFIILLGYCTLVFSMDFTIKRTEFYGYCIYFEKWPYIQLVYIVIISGILLSAIMSLGRKVSNNTGFMLIIGASVVTIAEVVLKALNIEILTNQVIGDICWIVVLFYGLNTLKVNKVMGK